MHDVTKTWPVLVVVIIVVDPDHVPVPVSVFSNFVDPDPYSEYGSGSKQIKIGQNGGKRCKM